MSIIAEFSIPADGFALGELLDGESEVQVRLESVIPTAEHIIPYVWIRGSAVETVEETLRESPTVEDVQLVDRTDEETLFHLRWAADANGFIDAVRDTEAVILEGRGHDGDWSFQLRFPEYEALSAFYRDVVERGIPIDLGGVHGRFDPSTGNVDIELTAQQREAIQLAHEEGYFAVPRGITLTELAAELEISDSAVSQRIRRGLDTVLTATVARRSSRQ